MNNQSLQSALRTFERTEENYVAALREKGLAFAEAHARDAIIAELRTELAKRGAEMRNAGASIRVGWLSPACVECTGANGSETFSTTFKCHRDCYFCFNYNLADYDTFVEEGCPWEEVMQQAAQKTGGNMAVVGLTGGEPLLNFDDTLAFLARAHELFGDAHKRMYTSGDLLTEEMATRLRDAGLDEIRFSIKQDDTDEQRERVLANMAMATEYIPSVMVEMPIIPGTEDAMREWMRRFDEAGIDGMNLLEFCFPFHSWEEFAKRGFELRNPPFDVMYDYNYSGGLAIDGSEQLALELMVWALDEGLSFGMHYCSLDNKHRSEMRQMNEIGRDMHPCFAFDESDFFLKSAKVFGKDIEPAMKRLRAAGCVDFVESAHEHSVAFPLRYASALDGTRCVPVVSYNVLERDDQGRYLREVGLELL
ncbi:MAG: radical SAM protein [Coriobacteriales bacterium]